MVKSRCGYLAAAVLLLAAFALSCASPAAPPTEFPTTEPVPVIWDDDGSIDGVIALVYLLEHPSFDVRAATISPGIAHPAVFAPKLAGFLELLGAEGIPVAAGPEGPLSGDNAFPSDWRSASDRFWGLDLPDAALPVDDRTAAELIVDLVKSAERPVTIFVSGPLTNLAQALRLDPSIKDNIQTVEVMGGALEVGGNVELPQTGSLPAEWNIYIDPLAAGEVFAAGVEIRLTPLDATGKVKWTVSDATMWAASDNPAGSMAAQLLRQSLKDWSSSSVLIWDLVAALNASDRGLCRWKQVYVEIAPAGTGNEGQTIAVPDEAANVYACLSPNPGAYKQLAQKVFGGSQ